MQSMKFHPVLKGLWQKHTFKRRHLAVFFCPKSSFPYIHFSFCLMDENVYLQAETMLIKEIFEEHGKYLRNELRKKISKLRLNRSNNLSFSVDYNIVAENSFPKLEMEFADYGRFIEIRWHNITRNRKALFPQKTETAAAPRNVCSHLPKRV